MTVWLAYGACDVALDQWISEMNQLKAENRRHGLVVGSEPLNL